MHSKKLPHKVVVVVVVVFYVFGDNLRKRQCGKSKATAMAAAFPLISLGGKQTQEAQEFMTPCGFIDASVRATLGKLRLKSG